jgi:hypothetical protein
LLTQGEAEDNKQLQRRTIQGEGCRQEASPWLQFVAWHVHLARFGCGEILLTTRPPTGEPAEEGLADVMVRKEEREDSARMAAASRATCRLIRRALKTVARETLQFGWRSVCCFACHKPSAYRQQHHPSTSATFLPHASRLIKRRGSTSVFRMQCSDSCLNLAY